VAEVANGSAAKQLIYNMGDISPVLKKWRHVVMTWTATGLRIYLDGALAQSLVFSSFTPVVNVQNFRIGKDPVYTTSGFKGVIDDTRVWNPRLVGVRDPSALRHHQG